MFRVLIVAAALFSGAVVAAPIAVADPPYKNCNEAWEDGKSNIPEDDPGYRAYLDDDHDGIACEFGHETPLN